jgi:glucose dehydrogenase
MNKTPVPNTNHFKNSLTLTVLTCAVALFSLGGMSSTAFAEDWPKFNRDLGNTAHSAELGISSENVGSLQSKWSFQTGGLVSSTPVVATIKQTHMVFVGAWNGVFYGLNAVTGAKVWSFPIDYVGGRCTLQGGCRIGSSAAVDTATKMVFFGAFNGYLYALDAGSGKEIWKQRPGDSRKGYEIWSSPTVYNGMVFVGVASHGDAPCVPGGLVNAYDELTGKLVWTFNTIDQSTCPNGGTCVGASVWSSLAIDDVNGIVYAATGNPGSTCMPATKNAGLYPDSILALSASTGRLLNYFQALNDDTHDLDFGASPILHATGETNQCTNISTSQYWVTDGSKDGYLYTLGRNANGLTGNEQQNLSVKIGFTATSGVRPATSTKSCDKNGHNIIDYVNTIYAPGSGGAFWIYQQDPSGKMSLEARNKLSEKALWGAPAVIRDVVFFGGSDGNFYISGKFGEILKTIGVGSAIYGGTAISNGRVYFGSIDGNIHCMSINAR